MRDKERQQPVILIGNSDREIREQLSAIVADEGYRVEAASDGKECLNLFATSQPDVVVVDAMMPQINGFEYCELIAKLHSNNRTSIVMTSSLKDKESIERAFAAGAVDYILEPVDPIVFQQRIRRLLEQARLYRELEAANRRLERLAFLDDLTQVANRRRFDEVLDREWRRMCREQLPLSILFCDLDCFKSYNDTYGHPAGDSCLQKVAEAIHSAAKRPADLVARYGGEEFAVILPNTRAEGAVHVAEEMRRKVRELAVEHRNSSVLPAFRDTSPIVTLSIGVTCIVPQLDWRSTAVLTAADEALYRAKTEGRDRVVLNSLLSQTKNRIISPLLNSFDFDRANPVASREYFQQVFSQEWLRMRRAQLPLSLLMCEIDPDDREGKNQNEITEQIYFDLTIEAIRNAARRPGDLVARYGEEEFVAILPNTKSEGAIHVAEKMRSNIRGLKNTEKIPDDRVLTLSIGISTTIPCGDNSPIESIDAADIALAKAKAQGRDRIVSSQI